MLFRVYDTEKKKWIKENVYLTTDGELFSIKKYMFGLIKVPTLLSFDRYVYHKSIELQDRSGYEIFEGDFIKAQVEEDKFVVGVVVFANELSAYIILCEETNEFYTLGTEVCEYIEKIGNVFDGHEDLSNDSQQAL